MDKKLTFLLMAVGSAIGGYLPMLWGSDAFSFSSIMLSAAGGIAGIYASYRLSR